MVLRKAGRKIAIILMFVAGIAHSETDFRYALEVESQGSYSRLKVSLDSIFKPALQMSKDGKSFELKIPGATLMDLGVPFGEEGRFQEHAKRISDSRISGISVTESGQGVIIQGRFLFPEGAQALANPRMDHFDFRQEERRKYVLDFWYQKGPTLDESKRLQKIAMSKKLEAEKAALLQKEDARRQERQLRMEEAKNALRFCEQPFDRANTVLIKYRSEHPLLSFNGHFPELIPDHRFDYTIPKNQGEEADMARLALKLSQDNKHALVIKTVDFLEKEYPKSKYLSEMKFLKASSYFRLEMEDRGRAILKDLSKVARGSEVGLQSAAFLALQSYRQGEWLAALESFLYIRREFPKHPLNWLFRHGVAECFYQIRQFDQAKDEYEWVAENAPKPLAKAEAAFKVGDLFFERGQYALALQQYLGAVKKFESQLLFFPQVLINLGETYFQLEEFPKATQTFQQMLSNSKNHPSAWRASLRIAEIKALHQKMNPEIEAAFMENINQYPMTIGATIARLRVLPCGSHGGFDLPTMERFLSSIRADEMGGVTSIYLNQFKELAALTEVRSLLSFNKDEWAIEKGMAHLAQNPSIEVRKLIEKAMIGGIKRLMSHQLESGNVFGAIALFERYGDYLPLPSHDPVADDLRMQLAKFAADRNLKSLALRIIEPYRQVSELSQREIANSLARSLSLDGVSEQEERWMMEAKTVWNDPSSDFSDREKSDTFIAKVSSIRDQSIQAFERDLIRSLFYSFQKDHQRAFDVIQKLIGRPEFKKLDDAKRAQIFNFAGETALAIPDLPRALSSIRDARMLRKKIDALEVKVDEKAPKNSLEQLNFRNLPYLSSQAHLIASEGEILEQQNKWKEAIALYTDSIENKKGGNRILFAHARVLLKEGGERSRALASESLGKIKQSQDDDVWKKLAEKTLEQIAKEGVVNGNQSKR